MQLKTLFAQAKNGQEAAQKLLFDQTYASLNSVALRYMLDKSLAEDVLQESYIRIYRNLHQFEYIDEPSTIAWMKRITATESLRLLKKRKRWNEVESLSTNEEHVDHEIGADDIIMQALLSLPARQRLVFNMHAIEGYNHKEIASHLDIAESSSRALLTRARAQLQSIISKKKIYEKAY